MDSVIHRDNFKLHDSFTIRDCTFVDGRQAVIYSPLNCETMLCDESVIRFLTQLEARVDIHVAINEFITIHPTHADEMISKLKDMKIIKIINQTS